MTDRYEQQLVRELELHAEAVTDPRGLPGLAPRLIHQARRTRRRRTTALAVGGSAVAAALVIGTFTAPQWGRHAQPTTPTPAPTATTAALASRELTEPYALVGAVERNGEPMASSSIALGGKKIRLPDGWDVSRLHRAGEGVVIDASVFPDSGVTAYVAPSGRITRLPAVGGPVAVTPDGQRLAGIARPFNRDGSHLVLVDLPSGHVVAQLRAYAALSVFADRTAALAADPDGGRVQLIRWGIDGASPTVGRLPGTATSDQLIGADGRGHALLLRGTALRLISTTDGSLLWSVERAMTAAAFSPDRSQIALMTKAGVTVISATDGSEVSRSAPLPTTGELGQVAWLDDRTVVASGRADITAGWLVVIDAQTGRLARLSTPAGTLVLPTP